MTGDEREQIGASEVIGAVTFGRQAFDLLAGIKGIPNSGVVSAVFDWDGKRIRGSRKIKIDRMPDGEEEGLDKVWWYHVRDLTGYTFLRFPVVDSGISELVATLIDDEDSNKSWPDAMYWRWVTNGEPGRIYGGVSPNVRVKFVVIGYRIDSLMQYFKS